MEILDARAIRSESSLSPKLGLVVQKLPKPTDITHKVWTAPTGVEKSLVYGETEDGYFHAVWVNPTDPTGAVNGEYPLDDGRVIWVEGGWHGNSMSLNSKLDELDLSGPVMECIYFSGANIRRPVGMAGWIMVAVAIEAVETFLPDFAIGLDDKQEGVWKDYWRLKEQAVI